MPGTAPGLASGEQTAHDSAAHPLSRRARAVCQRAAPPPGTQPQLLQDAADGAAFFYVGGFHRGLRHGLGVAIFANGEEFSGELAADAPHGYGVARLGSKKGIYEGQWAHGMRHGWAVSTLPNNSMWAGARPASH